MNKTPREIIINKALTQPDHLWGVERKLALTLGLTCLTMLLLSLSITSWPRLFALILLFGGFICLKMMAKADPLMSEVYLRHIKYKAYYAPHSTPFCQFVKKYK